jgi:hypothetical protein
MEVRRKFIGTTTTHYAQVKYSVYALTFKGTDVQRLGDLILCPECNTLYSKQHLFAHLRKIHQKEITEEHRQLTKNKQALRHTPQLDWFIVEVCPRNTKHNFTVICTTKKAMEELIQQGTQLDAITFVRNNVANVIEDMAYFEQYIDHVFKKYVGTKEDERKIKLPDAPTPTRTDNDGWIRLTDGDRKRLYQLDTKPVDTSGKPSYFLSEIKRFGKQINASKEEQEKASEFADKILNTTTKNLLSNGFDLCTVAGYLQASRELNTARALVELEAASGISRKRIFHVWKTLCKDMGMRALPQKPLVWFEQIVLDLNAPENTRKAMLDVYLKCPSLFVGRTPFAPIVALFHTLTRTPVRPFKTPYITLGTSEIKGAMLMGNPYIDKVRKDYKLRKQLNTNTETKDEDEA